MPEPAAVETPAAAADAPAAASNGKPPETILQAFERLGGFGDDTPADDAPAADGAAPTETPAVPGDAAAPDAKAKPATPAKKDATPPAEAERAQFHELAKKFGFEVEGAKVTSKERAEFREAKKRHKDGLATAERELMGKVTAEKEQLLRDAAEVQALRDAKKNHDFDALAVAFGHKDYAEMQDAAIAQLTDPNYKELRELKQKWKEQEELRTQEAEQRATTEANHRRKAAVAQYIDNLGKQMAASEDKLLATMAEDSWFVHSVHQIQAAEYDRDSDSTVTPGEALDLKVPGSRVTLRQQLTTVRDRLNKALGAPVAAAEAVAAAVPAKPAARTAAKAPSRTNLLPASRTEPSSPKVGMTDAEFRTYQRQRLEQAAEEDRKAELASRDAIRERLRGGAQTS